MRTRRSRIPLTIAEASSPDGAPVSGEMTSTPRYRPAPRTSPRTGEPAARRVRQSLRYAPVAAALAGRPSAARTSGTGLAGAAQAGVPPEGVEEGGLPAEAAGTSLPGTH